MGKESSGDFLSLHLGTESGANSFENQIQIKIGFFFAVIPGGGLWEMSVVCVVFCVRGLCVVIERGRSCGFFSRVELPVFVDFFCCGDCRTSLFSAEFFSAGKLPTFCRTPRIPAGTSATICLFSAGIPAWRIKQQQNKKNIKMSLNQNWFC